MFNAASIKQYFNTWGTECFIFPWSPKLGLCLASFAFEACLYCPRAEHILYTFGYRSDAPTINHNSSAPRVCDSDRTADEDAEQIELFVITAYPNTGMPAIIPPAPGMAGGKWNSPLCSVILLDFFPPSFFWLHSFSGIENHHPAQILGGHADEGKIKTGKTRWE